MDQSGNDSSGGVKFGDEDDEEENPEEKQVAEFLECCRRQPEQLLRYQLNGRPLTLDYQQGGAFCDFLKNLVCAITSRILRILMEHIEIKNS